MKNKAYSNLIFLPLMALLAALCVALCGCAKDEDDIDVNVGNITVGDVNVGNIDDGDTAAYGTTAKADVTSSVIYAYKNGERIYACGEYKNTGDCPIILSNAKFTLMGDVNITEEFVPELNKYLVLLPGETGYIARWFDGEGLSESPTLTLNIDLKAEKSPVDGVRLKLYNLYVADNYPGFSTLSGRISCPSGTACGANMLYVGFYDETDDFIGAWYFTKNALFEGGDEKNFVVNMQDFPFNDMASRTTKMQGIGFGFDF